MPIHDPDAPAALLVHLGENPPADVLRILRKHLVLRAVRLSQLAGNAALKNDIVIFDVTGLTEVALKAVTEWRRSATGKSAPVIFITDPGSRSLLLEARLNDEANLTRRPLIDESFLSLALQLARRPSPTPGHDTKLLRQRLYEAFPAQGEALRASDSILDDIFGAFGKMDMLDIGDISTRSGLMIDVLAEDGLAAWVDVVRSHHDMTYQHCLLVTGTLLAFGQHLKMNLADLERLAVGGLLHDLGKADIPLGILDKPSALSSDEQIVMRRHVITGIKRVKQVRGVTQQLLAFVGNHHEFLDGSGYPQGLTGDSISDPVRLLTIADIFSALIERRSYKREMPTEDAIDILLSMTTQLDQAILATVLPVLRKVRL